MELVVRKTDLLRELQLFQGIVERKNTIPILANVLLEANGEEVKMLATDLEVGLRSKFTASVSKGGSLTLPAKKLYEIIKALARDRRADRGRQGRRQGRGGSLRLPHADVAAGGFPIAPGRRPAATRPRCPATCFARWSRRRSLPSPAKTPATSSTARSSSCGPDSMGLVSTDGHRLALITVPREKSKNAEVRRRGAGDPAAEDTAGARSPVDRG